MHELCAIDDARLRKQTSKSIVDLFVRSNDNPQWNNHPIVMRIRAEAMELVEALRDTWTQWVWSFKVSRMLPTWETLH